MSSLNLYMQDEKDHFPIDAYSLKTFAILRDYLDPGTKLTLESVASSILNLMPEKDPHHGIEGRSFGDLCIEMGEQIPYHHPSQIKLVELLAYIGMSEKLGTMSNSMIKGSKSRKFHRYQLLGEELRENLNGPFPGYPLSYYVNFHAFAANLFEYRIFSNGCTWAIWALREAHEGCQKETGSIRDMYILASAQWILWYGQSFFKHIIYPGEIDKDTLRAWKPGPLYTGTKFLSLHRWQFWKDSFKNVASGGWVEDTGRHSQDYRSVSTKYLSLHRWQFWKDSFKNVASGDQDEKGGYSQECRSVSAKAADIMDALEKSMTL